MGIDYPSNGTGPATSLTRAVVNKRPKKRLFSGEIKTCRSIASRCAFILGPALRDHDPRADHQRE